MKGMDAYDLHDLSIERERIGKPYHEFLRVPSMSAGLYHLKAGQVDPQQPHNEDELYYIAKGRGKIFVGGEDRDVQAGSVVFVAAHVEHRFHSITEDMDILVFFAPAET
jgi:mannose-6-phosphate isomerase-like protein (cupin superfamily)